MRKHNQIHTLGTLHYEAHFRFLRKLKDFKSPHGLKNMVVALICSQAIICLPRTQKPVSKCYVILAVYGDNRGVVWVLRTTWCSWRAAHPKEEYIEFALINQRRSSNWGFLNLAKL